MKTEFGPITFEGRSVTLDSGCRGFEAWCRCSRVRLPIKASKNHRLDDWEKDYNTLVSEKRVPVENAICGMKRYAILENRYRGRTIEEYDVSLEITASLWNFKLLA